MPHEPGGTTGVGRWYLQRTAPHRPSLPRCAPSPRYRADPSDVPAREGSTAMAQTETKPGFRAPWNGDRPAAKPSEDGAASTDVPSDPPSKMEPETPDMIDVTTPAPARRTTELMADLSRAMQTAAEGARDEAVARL